ncbi:MAG: hypothetical protein Q8P59_04015 [Dehalococcoidia bacterium]|nr:hypothetical protein [Dehalococcoidia bacterium]
MGNLVKKLVAQHVNEASVRAQAREASSEALGRGILAEMRNTSNPELALQVAKDKLASDVSSYSDMREPDQDWRLSRKAQQVKRWADITEAMEEPMSNEAVTQVVMELAASTEFPTQEDWEKYSFMLDAPNPMNEVVDMGGFPAEEPRPYDGWDFEDPESMEPSRHTNQKSLKG